MKSLDFIDYSILAFKINDFEDDFKIISTSSWFLQLPPAEEL